MDLIIVHYHLRPGGIRRIIEQAAPHLVQARKIHRIVLATGEAADQAWHAGFARRVAPVPVEVLVEPAFNYLSEQRASRAAVTRRVCVTLGKFFSGTVGGKALVWAHNLGVGRNLILARELAGACATRQIHLAMHHHDWWFDNRWLRWPELRRWGFRTLKSTAKAVFPASRHVSHLAINQSDARVLRRHVPKNSGWQPNLTEREARPDRARVSLARQWLGKKLGDDAPVWILPCRLLRRKNVAEALLLTRWLRPEAWLVTTGGVSSADEADYAARLECAAQKHQWRLRLGVLAEKGVDKPSVPELLAASEAVMLTSIQEGFGLPFLEAAAAQRPLMARVIPNILPDLASFGFRFPQSYEELMIDAGLFDWREEQRRQAELFRAWRGGLPHRYQSMAGQPVLIAARHPQPVPFSRLTLTAQLEVLTRPLDDSWERCVALNPFLMTWQRQATKQRLQITPWPREADSWLSGVAYAKRFFQLLQLKERRAPAAATGLRVQDDFIRARLETQHLFPLLWSQRS